MNFRPGNVVACPVCEGYGCKFCNDIGWVTEARAGEWPDDATQGEFWAMLSNLKRPDENETPVNVDGE